MMMRAYAQTGQYHTIVDCIERSLRFMCNHYLLNILSLPSFENFVIFISI